MRTFHWRCCLIAASTAWCGVTFAAPDLLPRALSEVTAIEVAAGPCGGQARKSSHFTDQERIQALLVEFANVRAHPTTIQAAKFGCSTVVTFRRGAETLTALYLFPCIAFERAPVTGKRYFIYGTGLNQLPLLNRWVGREDKSSNSCK